MNSMDASLYIYRTNLEHIAITQNINQNIDYYFLHQHKKQVSCFQSLRTRRFARDDKQSINLTRKLKSIGGILNDNRSFYVEQIYNSRFKFTIRGGPFSLSFHNFREIIHSKIEKFNFHNFDPTLWGLMQVRLQFHLTLNCHHHVVYIQVELIMYLCSQKWF